MTTPSQAQRNKTYAQVLGGWTLFIILYQLTFTVLIFVLFAGMSNSTEMAAPNWFNQLLALHVFSFVVSLVLLIAYLRNIAHNPRLTSDSKVLWVVLILFLTPLSMAAYWYLQVWPSVAASRKR